MRTSIHTREPQNVQLHRLSKAKKYANALRRQLEPLHEHDPLQYSVPNLLASLRSREIGASFGPHPDSAMILGLASSDSREYVRTDYISVKHTARSCGSYLMDFPARRLIELDTQQIYLLGGLKENERFETGIVVDGEFSTMDGSIPPFWFIGLTDRGRLIVYDMRTPDVDIVHTYQLPVHLYKFRKLKINLINRDIFVYGFSKDMNRDQAVAVFELHPIRFKALFEVDNNIFPNRTLALLENDVLFIFSPRHIDMYNFDAIYKDLCLAPTDGSDYSNGEHVVPFNIKFTSQPKKMVDIQGRYASLNISNPQYILLEPFDTDPYSLLYTTDPTNGPLLGDLRKLTKQNEGCEFLLDGQVSSMMTHVDGSMRVLRFEGIFLACYDVESLWDGTHVRKYKLAWRTAIMPKRNEDIDSSWTSFDNQAPSSSSQLRERVRRSATRRGYVALAQQRDKRITLRILNISCSAEVMSVVIAYEVPDNHNPTAVFDETATEWVYLAIMMNSVSGRILRIADIDSSSKLSRKEPGSFSLLCEFDDDVLYVTSRDNTSFDAECYRLSEPAQEDWKDEIKRNNLPPYRSTAINRKEQRKRKRSRMGRLESDSVENDPDFVA